MTRRSLPLLFVFSGDDRWRSGGDGCGLDEGAASGVHGVLKWLRL
jgi:hypothetical protein